MEHLQQPNTKGSSAVTRALAHLQCSDQPTWTNHKGALGKVDHTVSLPGRHGGPVLHPPFYRSEAFAEDLVAAVDTLPVHAPRKRRRATLLFVVPLGAAFLGGALSLLNQIA